MPQTVCSKTPYHQEYYDNVPYDLIWDWYHIQPVLSSSSSFDRTKLSKFYRQSRCPSYVCREISLLIWPRLQWSRPHSVQIPRSWVRKRSCAPILYLQRIFRGWWVRDSVSDRWWLLESTPWDSPFAGLCWKRWFFSACNWLTARH